MNLGKVIIKTESGFFSGHIENNQFILDRPISKKSDVENYKDYKTLRQFFKNTLKLNVDTNRILSTFDAISIWVYDPEYAEKGMGKREWESGFYRHIHPLCQACKNKCKQSSKNEIISCKSYQKK